MQEEISGVGIDPVCACTLKLLTAVAARKQANPKSSSPSSGEQIPDAVADVHATRRLLRQMEHPGQVCTSQAEVEAFSSCQGGRNTVTTAQQLQEVLATPSPAQWPRRDGRQLTRGGTISDHGHRC